MRPVFSLQFFRSVQLTCTELLKVIEKYQHRITRESQQQHSNTASVFIMKDLKTRQMSKKNPSFLKLRMVR